VRLAFVSKLILADFLIRSNYLFINDTLAGNPRQLIQNGDTIFIPSVYQRMLYVLRIYRFFVSWISESNCQISS